MHLVVLACGWPKTQSRAIVAAFAKPITDDDTQDDNIAPETTNTHGKLQLMRI